MTDYKCEKCDATLETFDEGGILVIPACKECARIENNAETVEPTLPEKKDF